jgi:hypothetical protein
VPDLRCDLCGDTDGADDSVFHRLWECQHPPVLAARTSALGNHDTTQEAARARGTPDADIFIHGRASADPSTWPLLAEHHGTSWK